MIISSSRLPLRNCWPVKALVRRKYETKSTLVQVGDLELDLGKPHRKARGPRHRPQRAEYALLEYLAVNADRIVSRADIWQHVYDFNASLESNVVDVFVGLVRKRSNATVRRACCTPLRSGLHALGPAGGGGMTWSL